MLFFVDETWQTLAGGLKLGALGAVALSQGSWHA